MALWLEAPLQSWGFDSRFDRRDSLEFPTRSGVLGLICCAKGAGGEQADWLAMMRKHGQTVYAYRRKNSACFGHDMLVDFHMVGNGYDLNDPWETLMIPKTLDGKKPSGLLTGAKKTYRDYIQDTAFGVVLDVPEEEAVIIAEALKRPVWDVYLGRKCCVPTEFMYQGTFDKNEEAVATIAELATQKELVLKFTAEEGEDYDKGDVITLFDVPVQFGPCKMYEDRKVTVVAAICNDRSEGE